MEAYLLTCLRKEGTSGYTHQKSSQNAITRGGRILEFGRQPDWIDTRQSGAENRLLDAPFSCDIAKPRTGQNDCIGKDRQAEGKDGQTGTKITLSCSSSAAFADYEHMRDTVPR